MTFPKIIPPRSMVRLIKCGRYTPGYRTFVGSQYRIGYYSRQDGLKTIWLVDDHAMYFATTDRDDLVENYVLEKLSVETDLFGDHRRRIPARRSLATGSASFLPPLSLLRLKQAVRTETLKLIKDQIGDLFQVGYYTPSDGLEWVWIADHYGKYLGVIRRLSVPKYFRILRLGTVAAFCGEVALPSVSLD